MVAAATIDLQLRASAPDRAVRQDFVLQMRQFQDTIAEREEVELMNTFRSWTRGVNCGRW